MDDNARLLEAWEEILMSAPVLMVLGTASSVGKSTLVTALCRIAARRGIRAAPFKAQNMSNNAAVTADGGEIARSIAVQAAAARLEPTVQMNPLLIKPEGQRRSQIVVERRFWRTLDAQDYWRRKETLWEVVARNLGRPYTDGLRCQVGDQVDSIGRRPRIRPWSCAGRSLKPLPCA